VPIRAAWVQFWTGDWPQMNTDEHRLEREEGRQHLTSHSDPCSSVSICGGSYERIILSVDPAVSQRSTADCSALVTLGKTANNQVHCLEAIARRVSTPDLIELIDDADRRWRPELILFESNAAFAGIKELLVRPARFGAKI